MDLGTLFEKLAASTWQRLADAERLRVSQGETSITDHLLLEMARVRHPNVRVFKTPIYEEDTQGTDWEWWIGTPHAGWLRYAAQAKRVTVSSSRYEKLNHLVSGNRQLDILQRFASANAAIPVYCLYNYVSTAAATHWHCRRPIAVCQLGCSIAPIDVIERALAIRGHRTFDAIHRQESVVPWRCLVRCPSFIRSFVRDQSIQNAARGETGPLFGVTPSVYRKLPPKLASTEATTRYDVAGLEDLDPESYFDSEFYSAERVGRPRRIAVFDVSGSDHLGVVPERIDDQ